MISLLSKPTLSNETRHDAPRGRADTIHDAPADLGTQVRRTPRSPVHRRILLIPFLANGAPDWEHRLQGHTVDVSLDGLGLIVESAADLQRMDAIVVVSTPDEGLRCAGLSIVHTRRTKQGRLRAGGIFAGFGHDLLRPENLTPRFQPGKYQFELAYSEDVLDQWVKIGVLQPILWDRVLVCPQCQALPSFRHGCPACGSARIGRDRLIHHYACAHVGQVADFEAGTELACPKCRTRALVVASDYEYLQGPFRCGDCHWSADELEQVGQCHRCQLRFPTSQAHEQDLKGYHAHRLDPLALVAPLR